MSRAELGRRVNLLGPWLRQRFGGRVAKVGLDLGLGCPNRENGRSGCAFCTPLAAGRGLTALPLDQQWEQGRRRLALAAARRGQEPPRMLAYLQAFTSTHAPAPRLAVLYAQVAALPEVAGVIVSTRPDCLDDPRWEVLTDLAARLPLWLELGLQTANDHTLLAMDRGHDRAAFDAALAQARVRDLDVVAHVILGLPGEGRDQTDATADHLARLGVWGVKLHQLMVLEGSRLAADWRAGGLTPWSLPQWVAATAGFLARLPAGTVVHRLAADPGPETLLAPDWAGNKGLALDALGAYMLDHDLRQGAAWPRKP